MAPSIPAVPSQQSNHLREYNQNFESECPKILSQNGMELRLRLEVHKGMEWNDLKEMEWNVFK